MINRSSNHDEDESILNESLIFDIKDLVREEDRIKGMAGEVRTKGIIQFVLLQSNTALTDWILPSEQTFHDFVNRMECYFIKEKLELGKTIRWTNLWGSVGLLGLSAKKKERLEEIRDFISYADMIPGKFFTTIPKEMLLDRTRICTLFRNNLRSYDIDCFSDGIFKKNPGLKGSVGVFHVKTYEETDVTAHGESKLGWRLLRLQGDREFLKSLEQFPESHRFKLGSAVIQIRGGRRKAEQKRDPGLLQRGRGGFAGRARARGRGGFRGWSASQSAGNQLP